MTENEMIVKYSVTDASLAELRERFAVVPTVTDTKSLKALKADITVVRSLRGDVESTRKELKKDALEFGRRVDAEAHRITNELLKIEGPMKTEQKRYEDEVAAEKAEKARIEAERLRAINDRIDALAAIPAQHVKSPSYDIELAIEELNQPDDFDYQELAERYDHVIKKTKSALMMMLGDAQEREAEAERLAEEARLAREAAAERERLAEIERKEAEEERRRIAAEEAEQRAKLEAEAERERQKLAAEREEFERVQRRRAAEVAAEIAEFKQQQKAAREEAERQAIEEARKRAEFEHQQKLEAEKRAAEEAAEQQRVALERAAEEAKRVAEERRLQEERRKLEEERAAMESKEMEIKEVGPAEMEMVTITRAEYDALIQDQKKLIALEGAGVDNWDGYEMAMEALNESL